MDKQYTNRWYDKYPGLGDLLKKLQLSDSRDRDHLLSGIKKVIEKFEPDLVDQHVLEFPLSTKKRRWYDLDPYSWLAINSLKLAKDNTKNKVIEFLKTKLE